ncbi:MAG: CRISPR-associated endonuclease Cas4/Cas1 [Phycisphaeraceae bacterium]|nr:CRISPR-associated endonuclease Cas4/Cas1 [Phycisphaeraceae bacterium]
MLNEYAYCPRLFHLMHVEGRWEDNHYTRDGKHVHRRVDQLDHVLPDAEDATADDAGVARKDMQDDGDEPPEIVRSIPLTSQTLGITAKLDLVSLADQEAVPVETKRGRVPDNPQRSWEPERVQLMAQGLLLREQGYHCDHGFLYFAASRTRVHIAFTEALEHRTLELLDQAHRATQSTTLPLPLENSPKCHGCSLSGICLPDETLTSAALDRPLVIADADVDTDVDDADAPGESTIRRLYPARDEAQPLYVQKQGAFIGKTSQSLVVRKEKQKLNTVKLKDLNQVVICGNIGISAQAIHTLCEAGIPIVHLSMGHWFYGITHGINLRNAFDRAAQFQAAQNEILKLQFARYLVISKAINQRTMLRRNASNVSTLDRTLTDMQELIDRLPHVTDIPGMLGHEGMIAAHYFRHFDKMLKPQDFDATWDFSGRNRRPPKDPVNALLSFGYAFLTKEFTVALLAEGLDPWWGLYHKPRHGRPALALDLMEPFRPVVVDSAVITAINTGMTRGSHFTRSKSGCVLKPDGRKNFIRAYENRLSQLVTHPLFGYRCSWRSMIKLQARLFSRWLRKDIPHLPEVITR